MNRIQTCLINLILCGVVLGNHANTDDIISTKSNGDWSSCFYGDEKPQCSWQNGIWCDTSTNRTLESKIDACCFTINSKIDSLICAQKRTNLIFTAPDMNKTGQNPDTSFNNVYNGMNFSLQAWKMFQGSNPQQEISLLFGLPSTCDTSKPFEVTFYLFVQKNSGSSGDTGNIRISIDSKNTLQNLGPDFLMTVSTGDFAITEPLDIKNLQTLIVKKEFYAPALNPEGLLVLVFDRILPTNSEQDYSKDFFLESVVFSFYENECL